MRCSCMMAVVIGLVFPFTAAHAEKVDLSPQQLKDVATDVVVGKVAAIYQKTESTDSYRDTRFVTEVRVASVDKGGLKPGELVYVRYWRRQWIGKGNPPPGTNGHRGLPVEGQSLRVYLARNAYDGFSHDNHDGGYNVIGANGFEALPEKNVSR